MWFPVPQISDPPDRYEYENGETMTDNVVLEATPLTAVDRCDRCGAQAYVRATLLSGGELLFCAHHAKEYAEKLKQVSLNLQDETARLNESSAQ